MARPLRILVADDDAFTRRYFSDALALHGAIVDAVASGADAVAAIRCTPYDLVIADLRMPGPTGAELADTVRAAPVVPALVAVSGELPAGERMRLIAAGFLEALEKPVSGAALVQLLERVCGRRAADPVGVRESVGARLASPPRDAAAAQDRDLDDEAALRALGTPATVAAMRALLAGDLAAQCETLRHEIDSKRPAAAAGMLHRLRAACGLCGLPRLGALSLLLQRALESNADQAAALHEQWQLAASTALAALRAAPPGGGASR